MKDPNIKTKVVHSPTQFSWNVVGETVGAKYKIARVPYVVYEEMDGVSERNLQEARLYAEFISACFNNSEQIIKTLWP